GRALISQHRAIATPGEWELSGGAAALGDRRQPCLQRSGSLYREKKNGAFALDPVLAREWQPRHRRDGQVECDRRLVASPLARQNADTDFRQDAFHQPPRRRGLGRVVVMPSAFLPGSVGGGLTAFLVVLQAAHMPADVLGIDDLRALPLGDSLLPS